MYLAFHSLAFCNIFMEISMAGNGKKGRRLAVTDSGMTACPELQPCRLGSPWLLKTAVKAHFPREAAYHCYIVFKCFTGY